MEGGRKFYGNEIIDSVNGVLKKRLFSSVYGTFAISWAIFHWEFLYTLFAVDEKLILSQTDLLKHEYLLQEYFDWQWHLVSLGGISVPLPIDVWLYISWILPFLTTGLIIWWLPDKVLYPAFVEEDKYRRKKIKTRIQNDRAVVAEETRLIEDEEKRLKQMRIKAAEEKKVEEEDPEVLWRKEYDNFKKSSYFNSFGQVIKFIYNGSGGVNEGVFNNFHNLFVYLDSHGVINIGAEKFGVTDVSFTDKGKFFVAKYTEEIG